mmetsp:Transcript_8241/g.23674  ORF Transcript_8241/g.23674 Transcript_8241/m.23674 type:complete len:415 (+) Transcript_8241:330-1574(+)
MGDTRGTGSEHNGSAILAPDTIWFKSIEHNRTESRKTDGRPDAYLYFVGSKQGGKTTLLNRFLYPDRADVPKPTDGLEYTYARKSSAYNPEKKDIAHIWEMSGGEELADEVIKSEHVFLGQKQVTTAVVVVVVDLSKPSEVFSSLVFWLEKIRAKLKTSYEKLEQRGSKLPEQLRIRSRKLFGPAHEDKEAIDHTGIALVIAATKYDTFQDSDAELRKVMARTLRWMAHMNGASLVYLGGLGKSRPEGYSAKDTATDKALLQNFRTMLNHLVFVGMDKKLALKMAPEFDHMRALMVPMGGDKLANIGRIKGGDGGINAGIQEWQGIFSKMFPPQGDAAGKASAVRKEFVIDAQYDEPEVDALREKKDKELKNWKQEQEELQVQRRKLLAQRQAQQKAAMQKKAAGRTSARTSRN